MMASQTESDEEVSNLEEITDDEDKLKFNFGWADAMAKVLRQKKPTGRKSVVLSKAKKVKDVKEKKPKLDFEIVDIKTEEVQKEDELDEKKPIVGKRIMKEYQVKGRVKPNIFEKDRERILVKIATKGVVQLFNAVRQQQKTVDKTLKKAGKSERKREKELNKIDKKKFIDVLTGSMKSIPVDTEIKSEAEEVEEEATWSVLSDNFMLNSKLKNWDVVTEEEEA